MTSPPICFNFIAKVQDVYYQLELTTHNGFPVINKTGYLVGVIERDVLITLIQKAGWYFPNEYKKPQTNIRSTIDKRESTSLLQRATSMHSRHSLTE